MKILRQNIIATSKLEIAGKCSPNAVNLRPNEGFS
jgi:hypothetical protein